MAALAFRALPDCHRRPNKYPVLFTFVLAMPKRKNFHPSLLGFYCCPDNNLVKAGSGLIKALRLFLNDGKKKVSQCHFSTAPFFFSSCFFCWIACATNCAMTRRRIRFLSNPLSLGFR